MRQRAGSLLVTSLLAGVCCAMGCSDLNTPIYLDGPTPALELQGTEMIRRVTNSVTVRYRAPTMSEQATLDAQKKALGFDVPWVSRDKIHLEVLFTVKNLEVPDPQNPQAGEGTFDVVVDGANQYTKYDETIAAMALNQGNNNAPEYLPLISLHPLLPMKLAPGAVYQGTVREDDFVEGEGDLDAMGRWPAPDPNDAPPFPAALLNRSDASPLGMTGVPANVVTPALVEVDVTLAADKHMRCEWTLRVRDDDDRLWHVTGDPHFHPDPTLFQPTLPPKP